MKDSVRDRAEINMTTAILIVRLENDYTQVTFQVMAYIPKKCGIRQCF